MGRRVMPSSPHPIELAIVVVNGLIVPIQRFSKVFRPLLIILRPAWLGLYPLFLILQLLLVYSMALVIALAEWLLGFSFTVDSNNDQSVDSTAKQRNISQSMVVGIHPSESKTQDTSQHEIDRANYPDENEVTSNSFHPERKPFFLNLEIKRREHTLMIIRS
ncbi:MAG: hypothetical protein EVA79_06030 [Prochlorococcus sp. MED-G132]|nr:MAG: hypothetical protein EVA79_06030 [Prochlorococcus sp. MED-G132]